MKPLTTTDRNLVTVLLGGKVTNPASIASLAEKGLVRCGDTLTNAGREAAYMVICDHLPDVTRTLGEELRKAAAYVRKGMVAPEVESLCAWQDAPTEEGWHWIEGDGIPDPCFDIFHKGPLFIKQVSNLERAASVQRLDKWAVVIPGPLPLQPLSNRRVCPINGRPQ